MAPVKELVEAEPLAERLREPQGLVHLGSGLPLAEDGLVRQFREATQGICELHLPRRVALRLKQPGVCDEDAGAAPGTWPR